MIRKVFFETAWWTGLCSGGISLAFFTYEQMNGINPFNWRYTLFSISVPLIMVSFAIAYRRQKVNGGFIGTGEGVVTGLLTALIGTNIACITLYFLMQAQPEIVQDYIQQMNNEFYVKKAEIIKTYGVETYLKLINGLSNTTSTKLVLDYFIKSSAIQFIFALLLAAFFRKKAS
jgi:Protein of unknown function (DUF4199)